MTLDAIDRRLLAILQDDSTVPIAELAERVGLSQTPCWKRLKRMQDEGVVSPSNTLGQRKVLK